MKASVLAATFLALCVIPASATVLCSSSFYSYSWYCPYQCCFSSFRCCTSLASTYWYAWVIIVISVLLCICCCAGCGGYGYRRYYVRRVEYAPQTYSTLVANTTTTTSTPGAQYQPYANTNNSKTPPPPYNPSEGYQPVPPKS